MKWATSTPSEKFATLVAYVISPLILPPIFFGWLLDALNWPAEAYWRGVAIALVFLGVVPFLFMLYLLRSGDIRTLEVRTRQHRIKPFLASVTSGLIGMAVAGWMTWPTSPMLVPLLGIFAINTLLLALVNEWMKLSIHAASIVGFAAMTFFCAWWIGAPVAVGIVGAVLSPLVIWARIYTKAHTVREITVGATFGLVLPVAQMAVMLATGWMVLD